MGLERGQSNAANVVFIVVFVVVFTSHLTSHIIRIIRAKRVSNSHQGYIPQKKSVRVWVCVFD